MAYIGKKPSDITRAIATYDTFTGDGSTTTFTLTQGAASANDLTVVVNNVRQEPGTGSKSYTLTAPTSLIFNTAPAASDEIYVINPTQVESIARAGDISSGAITGQTELSALAADDNVLLVYDTSAGALRKIQKSNIATTLTYASGTATGDGSDTTFTINSGRSVNDVLVIVNGAILIPTTDYTISGTTLTFLTAPAADAEISIRYLPI
jgi:pyruvate/2-oxoacid:ferredoxin oxidoreductase beta subunit